MFISSVFTVKESIDLNIQLTDNVCCHVLKFLVFNVLALLCCTSYSLKDRPYYDEVIQQLREANKQEQIALGAGS